MDMSRLALNPFIVDQSNIEKSSRIVLMALLLAGIRARSVTHTMRTEARMDATLNFEFKGNFEGHNDIFVFLIS